MVNELKQLNKRTMKGKYVVVPIDLYKLTELEKRATLETINLIKEKINGNKKDRVCGYGSK